MRAEALRRRLLVAYLVLCVGLHRFPTILRRGSARQTAILAPRLLLNGADILLTETRLRLVIPSPCGVSVSGSAGEDFTVMPLSGIGAGFLPRPEDVGAGPGLPLLGARGTMAPHSGVLGPVRTGAGVLVMPGCCLTRDVGGGGVASPPRAAEPELPGSPRESAGAEGCPRLGGVKRISGCAAILAPRRVRG